MVPWTEKQFIIATTATTMLSSNRPLREHSSVWTNHRVFVSDAWSALLSARDDAAKQSL